MDKPLSGEKVAILVANGFDEQDFIAMQRMGQTMGAQVSVVSLSPGLVNSWNGSGWGLNFAVDKLLNEALAADFTMLMIPGGEKSAEKLQTTAHTKRFLNGFMDTDKSVMMCEGALSVLDFADQRGGRSFCDAENAFVADGNLMTMMGMTPDSLQMLSDTLMGMSSAVDDEMKQAA